jgi:hypothetical protein
MSTDPIFAAIAEHQRIYKAWKKAVRSARARDIEEEPVHELCLDASDRLFRTAPTTIAGILALLDYVIGKHDEVGHWGACGVEFPRPILRSIREGLTTAIEHDTAA